MGFEINKIIVAVLVTILVVFGIGKVSDLIYQTEKNVVAYKVDVSTESTAATTVSAEESIDISIFLAMGDVEHGKKVFKKCAACHSIKKDGGNKIGSALWNVVFRPVGAVADYKYSKALASYGKEWSWEELNGFLIKPSKWIPNNKMGFAGLKSEKDRASVILYLNQNSDNPKQLP
jgi:cytochrome c